MSEGTMTYQGKEYISGTQLAAEYNIERMRDGDDKFEQMTLVDLIYFPDDE